MADQNVPEPVDLMKQRRDYVAIKVPQFSWTRLPGADPFLGVGEQPETLCLLLLISQRWHQLERSLLSVKTSTRLTGLLSCQSTASSFLDLTRVSYSVVTSTDQKWPLSLPTLCDWVSTSTLTVRPTAICPESVLTIQPPKSLLTSTTSHTYRSKRSWYPSKISGS
jgi:hypothetical protein